MLKSDSLLEQLVQSPRLALYFRELQTLLQQEQKHRQEFYDRIRDDEKAEFINGAIVFHSPVRIEHNSAGKLLLRLLDTFVDKHQLGFVGYEKLMISLTRNDYEPDLCFFDRAKSDQFVPEQTQFPAPDFVVEILSPTTAARDRGIKFEDYAAHGISEYWIIDVSTQIVEQYLLQGGQYQLQLRSGSGELASSVIPGFSIPIRAIFDPAVNLQTLQAILLAA